MSHFVKLQGGQIISKGRRPKKKIADFQTFAQIGVGGSGKNLIQKINLIGTKY